MNFGLTLQAFVGLTLTMALATSAVAQDEAIFWNQQALQAIRTAGGPGAPPPKASRSLAMVSLAVYDSVNAISGTHTQYHYNGGALGGTSKEAAACQSAFDMLSALYPSQNFNSQYTARMNAIPDGAAKTQGIALGHSVATDIWNLRSNDGSANNSVFTGGTGIGQWRPTSAGTTGLLPLWGQVTPFGMTSGNQFQMGPPPAVNSEEYTAAYNEVKDLGRATGSTRTADQTDIAKFWADGGGTITPPGHWNQIAQSVSLSNGLSLDENARMFALLNIAEADAAIAAWDMKYVHNFWRPVTAIQNGDLDGNLDTIGELAWTPLIATTPPFPGFTSGHSTFSAAGGEILKLFMGTDNISFTTSTDAAGIAARFFNNFSAAVDEAGMSRIYGGIHFQFDNTVGKTMGRNIGGYVYSNYLSSIPEPSSMLVIGTGMIAFVMRRKKAKKI